MLETGRCLRFILLKIRNLIDAKSNSSEKKCERERREGVEGGIIVSYLNKWAGCVSMLKAANISLSLIEGNSKMDTYSPKKEKKGINIKSTYMCISCNDSCIFKL